MCLILFSFLILFSIIFILIWRYKGTITSLRTKDAINFSLVGIVVTIIYLICIVSLISMIYSHYEEINHPCANIERTENDINYFKGPDYLPTFEDDKERFCIDNPNYNSHLVPIKEYIIAFSFAGVLCIFMLVLIYSWFNDYRRIKFLIEGSLNDFDAQEVKNEVKKENEEENSNEKRINERIYRKNDNHLNIKHLYKIYNQQENAIRYDIYGRPIFKLSKENTKDINNMNTLRYNKRKSLKANNRININKTSNSINKGNPINDIVHSNSSERNAIKKFQITKTKNNITKTKANTNANLI